MNAKNVNQNLRLARYESDFLPMVNETLQKFSIDLHELQSEIENYTSTQVTREQYFKDFLWWFYSEVIRSDSYYMYDEIKRRNPHTIKDIYIVNLIKSILKVHYNFNPSV